MNKLTLPPFLSHNPVAWVAVINAAIDLAIAFGVPITDTEKAAAMVFIGAVSTLFVTSQVTSTAKLSSLGVTITPPTSVASVATVAPVVPPPPAVVTVTPPTPPVPPVGG